MVSARAAAVIPQAWGQHFPHGALWRWQDAAQPRRVPVGFCPEDFAESPEKARQSGEIQEKCQLIIGGKYYKISRERVPGNSQGMGKQKQKNKWARWKYGKQEEWAGEKCGSKESYEGKAAQAQSPAGLHGSYYPGQRAALDLGKCENEIGRAHV